MFIESVFGMVGADTRALWADISERRVVAPPHNIYPWVEAGQAYHDILYVGGITDRNDGLIGLRTARPERSVTTYALAQTAQSIALMVGTVSRHKPPATPSVTCTLWKSTLLTERLGYTMMGLFAVRQSGHGHFVGSCWVWDKKWSGMRWGGTLFGIGRGYG